MRNEWVGKNQKHIVHKMKWFGSETKNFENVRRKRLYRAPCFVYVLSIGGRLGRRRWGCRRQYISSLRLVTRTRIVTATATEIHLTGTLFAYFPVSRPPPQPPPPPSRHDCAVLSPVFHGIPCHNVVALRPSETPCPFAVGRSFCRRSFAKNRYHNPWLPASPRTPAMTS